MCLAEYKCGMTFSGRTGILLATAISLALATGNLQAAKPVGGEGKGVNCTISLPQNDPVAVTTGGSVLFQGVVAGGTEPYNVTWDFAGGSPASAGEILANSGDQTQQYDVSFNGAGNFTVTLATTDSNTKRAKTCSATRTVNVSDGTGNSRPVAQDDDYNTTEGVPMVISAPGVLFNDNDPDGDPMTVVLEADLTNGNLTLNDDGSFTYDPQGFIGSESFTYTANDAGGASNTATVTLGIASVNAVSINSTSANGAAVPDIAVGEGDITIAPGREGQYSLVAINDLGMHCGDLDTRISSILPPFNVLHAQVIQRGRSGLPRVLNEGEVTLEYSAASNPNDPALSKSVPEQALSSVTGDGGVYKTNFWDIASQAYGPFYPAGILDAFYDSSNPANNVDIGLPVPDIERFYLGDGALHASQQAMPGFNIPYSNNEAQVFHEHIGTMPFFTNFPFGYTTDLNLFEAPGVPIAAFDDFGRENPYPLVRVQAKESGDTVASLDIVMPISGEAECQACHSIDVGTGTATENLDPADRVAAMEDPLHNSSVPFAASVEWASDINILRLHDQKHGDKYNCLTPDQSNPDCLENGFDAIGKSSDPVVCQTCHYTPALDLAQFGPLGPENDNSEPIVLPNMTLAANTLANGRDQVKHKSMSNVMHSHHGATGLFPDMPPAIDDQGNRRDPVTTQTILEETCYMCHPGRRTECMRGAMANGGLVCQDCHGQMAQVGDDFSRNVSPDNPGDFHLGADFYDEGSTTPRVPWANEPGCGSCHTGYATDNLAGEPNVLVSPTDTLGNTDGIRLLAAYRTKDNKATPIVPTNKAFAENVVTEDLIPDDEHNPIGNPKLYRVSTGHGGLFCESCHGSTHAEWPTANPNANDNVPASQLQGHSGYIAECQVCHDPNDASLPLGNNGPHGMHPVSDRYVAVDPDTLEILDDGNGNFLDDPDSPFVEDLRWNTDHKSYKNDGPGCNACHGADLKGTVLSRTAKHRVIKCKDNKGSLPGCAAGDEYAVIPKGTPVGCGLCHRQKQQ